MTLFAARHTARWALANLAEFDRRHLHGAGRWLFGRRPVRAVRPPRRIGVLVAGTLVGLSVSGSSSPYVATCAGLVVVLAAGIL